MGQAATYYNTSTATCCYTLQHAHCNTLQRTATHCNTQIASRGSETTQQRAKLQHTATHTLQHTATHCNTHTAKHCNTLKHTATHRSLVTAAKQHNKGLTALKIGANTHFFRRPLQRNHLAATKWSEIATNEPPKRKFGDRLLAHRKLLTAQQVVLKCVSVYCSVL